jgi:hypothetical protein
VLGRDLGANGLDAIRAQMDTLGRRSVPHPVPDSGLATDTAPGDVPDGALVAVLRSLLLDRGTMLAGADDLMATARDATVTLARRDAVERGIADGDLVRVRGAAGGQVAFELPAVVVDDLLPGVVVLPRTSTEPTANVLAGDDGRVHVTVERVASTAATDAVAQPVEVGA